MKTQVDYIKECIGDLVYSKTKIRKAYNYYHCKRDPEQFKHIEDKFGLGSATSVSFTPLIKKHIDVLVGEYLELDPTLDITCKDEATISNIMRDKQIAIAKAVNDKLKQYINNAIMKTFNEAEQGKEPSSEDPLIVDEINKLKASLSKSYISDYEIAAYNILDWFKQSRNLDMQNKFRELFTDLLISGVCYYRVKVDKKHHSVNFEVTNPLDTFIERNPNEFYLNKSPRAVIRKWKTEEEILMEYGDEMSEEAKSTLSARGEHYQSGETYVHSYVPLAASQSTPGILGGLEVTPVYDYEDNLIHPAKELIEVYECEWIEVDKNGNNISMKV